MVVGYLWGIRPEVSAGRAISLVTRLPPLVVDPSRKLRRFESFTCHHVPKGPLMPAETPDRGPLAYPVGVRDGVDESVISAFGRRPVTCTNADERTSGVDVRAEYVRKFVFAPSAARIVPRADLCRYQGGGMQ